MRILALAHGLIFGGGGAQIAISEFLKVLKNYTEVKVITCRNANTGFISNLKSMGLSVFQTPCDVIMGYPVLSIENVKKHIEWADVVWITDVEYSVASRIKRIRKVPIVAHIHSYALVCPSWGAFYRYNETCLESCSAWRLIGCKQGINMELRKIGMLDNFRARTHWLMDFVKGSMD